MVVNKKGQFSMILGVMLFMFAFITAVLLSSSIKELTEISRDSSHLDCTNTTALSAGEAMSCVAVDLYLPFFVITIIGIGATLVTRSAAT